MRKLCALGVEVWEGVLLGVPLELGVGVAVRVAVEVAEEVEERLAEALPMLLPLAEGESEAEADTLGEELSLRVAGTEGTSVAVELLVVEAERDTEMEPLELTVPLRLIAWLPEPEMVAERVLVLERV